MECLTTSFARNVGKEYSFVCSSKLVSENQWIPKRICCYVSSSTNSSRCRKFTNMAYPMSPIIRKRSRWRSFAASLNLEDGPAPSDSTSSSSEQTTDADGTTNGVVSENLLSRKLSSDELKALLADSERSKLLRRLSEANQYNRFLKRQLQIKDDAVVKFKGELAVLELELQALVGLAEEIANFDVPLGSRRMNGKYIQSHLLSRLEAVHDKIMEQIKDVESLKTQEISVYWVGMAENVQIMGSFDGWSQGEAMSMEYSGDYGRFSATLKLRPGRYEIKFLVDGEWRLSPEYPTAGDGMTQNNILIVE
ncbi:protein PTST, chloroplastic-like [Miscanthus floridulus]|uniref:protein PTST, chloroplastic-like n=1 Tax=Miscanthus floridulus TaxID=154761 RepID=UPI003457CFC1